MYRPQDTTARNKYSYVLHQLRVTRAHDRFCIFAQIMRRKVSVLPTTLSTDIPSE